MLEVKLGVRLVCSGNCDESVITRDLTLNMIAIVPFQVAVVDKTGFGLEV